MDLREDKSVKQMDEDLILVSGSGKSRVLAQDMAIILKKDYGLENKVNVLISKRADELTIKEKENKDNSRPLLIDRFEDGETRVEAGKRDLEFLKNKHVCFVNYFYEPEENFSVNDKIAETRAFGELLRHVPLRKLTVAAPYWPYIQAHSVEKYEKKGFMQANTLRRFMRDIYDVKETWPQKHPKIEIVVIDAHNNKIKTYCENIGLEYRHSNPFQKDIDYTKLGLKEDSPELERIRPIYGAFMGNPDWLKDGLLVALDVGTEERTKNFAYALGRKPDDVLVLDKLRVDTGERVIKVQPYSALKESDIKDKICIGIDDMGISYASANTTAKWCLEHGAKSFILIVSHNKCQVSDEKIKSLSIEEIVHLDTMHKIIPKGRQLCGAAALLSFNVYKGYKAEIAKQEYA